MPGDLHTHTNFSDGSSDIELLPFLAAREGLEFLAVSDHDTALSAQYAYDHPIERGVRLIPAVELTALDAQRGRKVHFLCYCPDLTQSLRAFFDLMAQRRNAAAENSGGALEKIYPQFTLEAAKRFSARGGVTYKTHMMRLLYEYGYTDGIYKDLYKKLFGGLGGLAPCEPQYESVDAVLDIARAARGVVVLAHPSVYGSMELAKQLAREGRIDGVEVDHPRNTEADKTTLRRLARECGLLVTGGTDFHGLHMSQPVPLGAYTTQDNMAQRILALAAGRKG